MMGVKIRDLKPSTTDRFTNLEQQLSTPSLVVSNFNQVWTSCKPKKFSKTPL